MLCALCRPCAAQQDSLLGREGSEEMRGAWLATVAGLDWPCVDDPAIVQLSLIHI